MTDALGSLLSVSFWELPALIEVAEKAKLSTDRLRIQYEGLLSRPILCLAMVLLAATVSLRSFRAGGIQTMVVAGLVGGFGFFLLSEVSRQIVQRIVAAAEAPCAIDPLELVELLAIRKSSRPSGLAFQRAIHVPSLTGGNSGAKSLK